MTPYEIMLSESQERMLLVPKPENVAAIRRSVEQWDLESCDDRQPYSDGMSG